MGQNEIPAASTTWINTALRENASGSEKKKKHEKTIFLLLRKVANLEYMIYIKGTEQERNRAEKEERRTNRAPSSQEKIPIAQWQSVNLVN